MSREIKFKGKSINNGEWIYGYYFYSLEHKRHLILPHDSVDAIPVDPKTVGQFTGLLDKKGKEIYEGDLLRGGIYKEYLVEWEAENGGWNIAYSVVSFEITGNIHETL